ncbi:MAG: NAD-dependent epimerase/dehydratase family protein [Actinomycetota bacterium]|nr:NAD-dependent epimerase/dehydratase family protein [Actinomycetota bacterium]
MTSPQECWVLVTGASGRVGSRLATTLAGSGHRVRGLVRDAASADWLSHRSVEPVVGDVSLPPTIRPAVEGSEVVYNAMGVPEQWRADVGAFDRVNAEGTAALVEAARSTGVRRLVHLSTIDVFDAAAAETFDETRLATGPKRTAYQRSKQRAEEIVLSAPGSLEVVVVNSAAVIGGRARAQSLGHQLFLPLVRGRLPLLPPGALNVVGIESLVTGLIMAAERGAPGERYILSDGYVTIRGLARLVLDRAGRQRLPPTLPAGPARVLSRLAESASRVTRRRPLLSAGQLEVLLWGARADAAKAERELLWQQASISRAVSEALEELAGVGRKR